MLNNIPFKKIYFTPLEKYVYFEIIFIIYLYHIYLRVYMSFEIALKNIIRRCNLN